MATIGICFAAAVLALAFGYSVALGAFIAGSLVAESGESVRIEQFVHPVRDMFVAIFFVSVGMLIDPKVIVEHAGAIAAFTVLVIAGKVLAVTVGSFLTGNGLRLFDAGGDEPRANRRVFVHHRCEWDSLRAQRATFSIRWR